MITTYDIYLRASNGQRLVLIDSQSYFSLSLGRSIYGEGAVELSIPATFPFSQLTQDSQLEIYRIIHLDPFISGSPENLSYILLEDGTHLLLEDGTDLLGEDYKLSTLATVPGTTISQLLTDTVWLITDYKQKITGSSNPYYWIKAEPFVSLCKRRIVANAADSAQASKTARGDDMMKAIMREQFGASATDGTRDISAYLKVDADAGGGVSMTKAFARRNVFTVLQEISQAQAQEGTRVYFDVTYDTTANLATFRTYVSQRGTDHSRTSTTPVIFGASRNNIADPELDYNFTSEVNFAYALGQGTGADRLEITASDATRMAASVFNRREIAYDARQYSTTTGLSDEANAALWAGRPQRNIGGTLLSTPDTAFGIHWNYGDLIVAEFGAIQQDSIIESVSINLANGMESITAIARGIN